MPFLPPPMGDPMLATGSIFGMMGPDLTGALPSSSIPITTALSHRRPSEVQQPDSTGATEAHHASDDHQDVK